MPLPLATCPPTPAGLVEVRRPQWVSEARHTEDGWQLVGRGRQQGFFDAVVIAHNGAGALSVGGGVKLELHR